MNFHTPDIEGDKRNGLESILANGSEDPDKHKHDRLYNIVKPKNLEHNDGPGISGISDGGGSSDEGMSNASGSYSGDSVNGATLGSGNNKTTVYANNSVSPDSRTLNSNSGSEINSKILDNNDNNSYNLKTQRYSQPIFQNSRARRSDSSTSSTNLSGQGANDRKGLLKGTNNIESIPLKRTSMSSFPNSRSDDALIPSSKDSNRTRYTENLEVNPGNRPSGLGNEHDDDISDDGASFLSDNPDSGYRPRFEQSSGYSTTSSFKEKLDSFIGNTKMIMTKYAKFIGPGIMVSVAYMDPGNYSTAVSAGALYQYKLLFVVLLSNLFAVFLQILCAKLGGVTGLDLAQNCREHLPPWLSLVIYICAEIAIIATDLAEVIGTAISLNILFNTPLAVGVALTIIDVLVVLMAYKPNGPLRIVRYFEYLVSSLVALVVICFAIELSKIGPTDVSAIFRGFLPSRELVESQGLYLSCGILGATVMPHSLYLGSGLVQPRLKDFDVKHGYYDPEQDSEADSPITNYRPTIHAIKYAMHYSIAELIISLFTVAIFVNSAILIVAGATLSDSPDAVDADLFSIYDMLKLFLSPAAGTLFALALLFSGQSAGIVCTLAGQMVSEGFLQWSIQPWIRRLVTRTIAIAPCFVVSIFVGRKGLATVLNASQVLLSLMLPLVSFPLLYFTASKKIMSVPINNTYSQLRRHSTSSDGANNYVPAEDSPTTGEEEEQEAPLTKDMSNSKLTNIVAGIILTFVSSLNIFLIVSMALGADVHL